MTHQKTTPAKADREQKEKEKEGLLERIAEAIDPAGREVSDQDLKDPGRMTPRAPPTDNRS